MASLHDAHLYFGFPSNQPPGDWDVLAMGQGEVLDFCMLMHVHRFPVLPSPWLMYTRICAITIIARRITLVALLLLYFDSQQSQH